jgi:putative two-component system response regulator
MSINNRIMVIDDNVDNLMILDELLGSEYNVRCAKSGEEAVLAAPDFKPTLILMDVMMPGLNGNETCELLRSNPGLKATKIVMVSALGELRDRLAGYKAGAVDYITKPFFEQEVLAKVRTWMGMSCREEVEGIWNEIDAMRDAMGMALVRMASFRDVETGEHLVRMRSYSGAIAAQMSFEGPYSREIDRPFKDQLYRASPLHDIGKVGIPDVILRKPGPLTDAEFETMKLHTVIGADILKQAADRIPNADYLKMAVDIAWHHHERFDGGGYPNCLAGSEIPLSARIVAVADALDALTSRRVYKEPVPIEDALSVIESGAGTHFDPPIVEVLRRRIDAFRQIMARCAECAIPAS